jgi:integrase
MSRGEAQILAQTPSLSRLLDFYLKHRTPRKVASEQQADHRRSEMWQQWLGAQKDMSKLSLRDWEGFIDARRSGEIDADGMPVEANKRQPVRDGTVWADLVFLLGVLNWATKWREGGQYLLKENVARGFPLPREKNVRRPVVSAERYQKVLAAAPQLMMRIGQGKKAREEPSYLPELLVIAWGTGRRFSAIINLRYSDLRLSDDPPAIVWPADTDKVGVEWRAPINADVRAAIGRTRADRQFASQLHSRRPGVRQLHEK